MSHALPASAHLFKRFSRFTPRTSVQPQVQDASRSSAWMLCERGDQMLTLAARMVGARGWPSHQRVVLAACECIEAACREIEAIEARPQQCVEAVRRWATGCATLAEVQEARAAAYKAAVTSADRAVYLAGYAAYAVAAAADAGNLSAVGNAAYSVAGRRPEAFREQAESVRQSLSEFTGMLSATRSQLENASLPSGSAN